MKALALIPGTTQNNEREDVFRKKYPEFRHLKLMKEERIIEEAA